MHHQHLPQANRHALLAQPIEQHRAVGRVQDVGGGVLPVSSAHASRHRQQVQVMVAQNALRAAAIGHQAAQHAHVVGATVDQVTQQVQRVTAWRKANVGE